MTNNRQTCPFVLRDLRGTHNSRELSVMYLIDFILLSHLQLIKPLYELFLVIMKPALPLRKFQEVALIENATTTKDL